MDVVELFSLFLPMPMSRYRVLRGESLSQCNYFLIAAKEIVLSGNKKTSHCLRDFYDLWFHFYAALPPNSFEAFEAFNYNTTMGKKFAIKVDLSSRSFGLLLFVLS